MDDSEILNSIDEKIRDGMFEKVKDIHNAPYSRFNGIDIVSVKDDETITKMKLTEDKMNSLGFAHGGVIFTLADCTFAFAANIHEDEPQIALSSNIVYHKPGTGKELTAVSRRVSETRSLSTYEVTVFCDGKHISTATFIGFKTGNRLKR